MAMVSGYRAVLSHQSTYVTRLVFLRGAGLTITVNGYA
jgi:hypothetical protein